MTYRELLFCLLNIEESGPDETRRDVSVSVGYYIRSAYPVDPKYHFRIYNYEMLFVFCSDYVFIRFDLPNIFTRESTTGSNGLWPDDF